jgi:hypothetical protein
MLNRNPDPQGRPNFVVPQSPTLVKDRVQYAPNYDAKKQTGMESAMDKVGNKTTR